MSDGALTETEQEFVSGVVRLVHTKVKELVPWAKPPLYDDLVQGGLLGAARSARRYDLSYASKFATYAGPAINGGIIDALDAERPPMWKTGSASQSREFLAEHPEGIVVIWDEPAVNQRRLDTEAARHVASQFASLAGGIPTTPEEEILRAEPKAIVRRALANGEAEHRRLFELRYVQNAPLKVIAVELGVDVRTLHRWHEELLDRIHAVVCAHEIREAP